MKNQPKKQQAPEKRFDDIDTMILTDIMAKCVFLAMVQGDHLGMKGDEVRNIMSMLSSAFCLQITKHSKIDFDTIADSIQSQVHGFIENPVNDDKTDQANEIIREIKS